MQPLGLAAAIWCVGAPFRTATLFGNRGHRRDGERPASPVLSRNGLPNAEHSPTFLHPTLAERV
jgi:hypothetical protein